MRDFDWNYINAEIAVLHNIHDNMRDQLDQMSLILDSINGWADEHYANGKMVDRYKGWLDDIDL